jgi:hypothetical protein
LWASNAACFEMVLNLFKIVQIVTDVVEALHEPSLLFIIFIVVSSTLPFLGHPSK